MASFVLLKNSTFSGFGFRAVQVGLQKIPVVFTPIQKTPSKLASLLKEALYMISLGKFINDD
jgi:hypothetical protein